MVGVFCAATVAALLLHSGGAHAVRNSSSKIDPDTPASARHLKPLNEKGGGVEYQLVFSDEFEQAGRSFAPGDDPFFTADNIWNQATNDMEYYDSNQVTTRNGRLYLTAEKKSTIPQCPYTSGMISSWNKLCIRGGVVEIRLQFPGDGVHKGWWPAAWMMSNLGRFGHQKSLNEMWPWTYDECDQNKQWQRISACNSTPGFGLNPNQGRGVPEMDIVEARIGGAPNHPFDKDQPTLLNTYHFTPKNPEGRKYTKGMILNNNSQVLNVDGDGLHDFIGSITPIDKSFFTDLHTFRFEWYPNDTLAWYCDNTFVFSLNATTLRRYSTNTWSTGPRMVSVEPSYLIVNLALSSMWNMPSPELKWPGEFSLDYIRIYQDPKKLSVDCSPPDYPTKGYIDGHPELYYD